MATQHPPEPSEPAVAGGMWSGLRARRDLTLTTIGVPGLLMTLAALELAQLALTRYGDGGPATAQGWWVVMVVALRLVWRGSERARRFLSVIYLLGVMVVPLVAVPGFSLDPAQAGWWYPLSALTRLFGLVVVTSPLVRHWTGGLDRQREQAAATS